MILLLSLYKINLLYVRDYDIYTPNLPQWSQAAPLDQNINASTTLLLASHHRNIASMNYQATYIPLKRDQVSRISKEFLV